jgi:hypothetical protein
MPEERTRLELQIKEKNIEKSRTATKSLLFDMTINLPLTSVRLGVPFA